MQKTKEGWIDYFRQEAERVLQISLSLPDKNKKSDCINKTLKQYLQGIVEQVRRVAQKDKWSDETLLNEMLIVTYASYIVMLEYRNKVWPYEYMSFARRIGELWEPFCKLPFEYSLNTLKIIEPQDFENVQNIIRKRAMDYISELNVSDEERRLLIYYYGIPWSLLDSGEINLALDLHFEQKGIRYNCDFKSGFSSNEKGNTNRLLLVGSVYNSISENEKTLLFVRQEEDRNNHYFQTLKKSHFWDCYCGNDCYSKIEEFTGFDLRGWLDKNVDWQNDIDNEFRKYLYDNELIDYLAW